MSQAGALDKAKRVKAVMLDYGVPEVSIELQTGRPNPYDPWDGLFVVADMSHHIVSNYNPSNLTPLLWLVKQGRTSVPGPLSNGYGGWDLCYRILCFSYANHPGAGGPRTVPRVGGGTYTIPKDSARRYVWGTEYEGGIIAADWDRLLRNPRNGVRMTMREFMGRAGAAIHDFFNNPSGSHMEHSTWAPLRKIDRLRYTASTGVAEEKRYADMEDDMPLNADDLKKISDIVDARVLNRIFSSPLDADTKYSTATFLRYAWRDGKWLLQGQAKMGAELAAIKNTLGQLLSKPGQPLDMAAVEAAALLGAQQAMAELDVTIRVAPEVPDAPVNPT